MNFMFQHESAMLREVRVERPNPAYASLCLLYTSDAADEL